MILNKIKINDTATVTPDVVYDISKATGQSYENLSDALSVNNVPLEVREGGMSVRFVTSDNKYIQARCMAQNFTTDVTQWQGVDEEPTAGSQNIVESGGVRKQINAPNIVCLPEILINTDYSNLNAASFLGYEELKFTNYFSRLHITTGSLGRIAFFVKSGTLYKCIYFKTATNLSDAILTMEDFSDFNFDAYEDVEIFICAKGVSYNNSARYPSWYVSDNNLTIDTDYEFVSANFNPLIWIENEMVYVSPELTEGDEIAKVYFYGKKKTLYQSHQSTIEEISEGLVRETPGIYVPDDYSQIDFGNTGAASPLGYETLKFSSKFKKIFVKFAATGNIYFATRSGSNATIIYSKSFSAGTYELTPESFSKFNFEQYSGNDIYIYARYAAYKKNGITAQGCYLSNNSPSVGRTYTVTTASFYPDIYLQMPDEQLFGCNPIQQSGAPIAEITMDGLKQTLYAPTIDSPAYNKVIYVFGDSITWLGGDDCDGQREGYVGRGWTKYFKDLISPSLIKSYARSGATLSCYSDSTQDITSVSEGPAANNVLWNQIMRMVNDINNGAAIPDCILIAMGCNDSYMYETTSEVWAARHAAIQNLLSDNVNTIMTTTPNVSYYGNKTPAECDSIAKTLRWVRDCFVSICPRTQVVIFTPLQSHYSSIAMQLQVSERIAECAIYTSWTVIDQCHDSGLSMLQEKKTFLYTADGTHPSVLGAQHIGKFLATKMKSILIL